MITGKLKEKTYDKNDLIDKIGSYNVYKYYAGDFEINRAFRSPMGDRDEHPSFVIHYMNGEYFHKHYSRPRFRGNAIDFVMQKFGIGFPDAIDKIARDFGYKGGKKIIPVITWEEPPRVGNTQSIHIAFSSCKFKKEHHDYWNAYHLSEDYLKKKNVFAVDKLSIGRRLVPLGKTIAFAYYAPEIDKAKILRIGVPKEEKWRNSTPFQYIWGLSDIKECKTLMICKSRKDDLVLSLFGLNTISTNAESISCFSEENVSKINQCKEKYLCYGTDNQGKEESKLITKEFGWKHYNTPDEYLPEINDPAELAKYDIKLLEEHLKLKGII